MVLVVEVEGIEPWHSINSSQGTDKFSLGFFPHVYINISTHDLTTHYLTSLSFHHTLWQNRSPQELFMLPPLSLWPIFGLDRWWQGNKLWVYKMYFIWIVMKLRKDGRFRAQTLNYFPILEVCLTIKCYLFFFKLVKTSVGKITIW